MKGQTAIQERHFSNGVTISILRQNSYMWQVRASGQGLLEQYRDLNTLDEAWYIFYRLMDKFAFLSPEKIANT